MTDNVIICGAGISADAGIPLLANFVDRMWEFAVRGKIGQDDLSEDDKILFNKVLDIREELNVYHGRASLDDRNIEDILSILSFSLVRGNDDDKQKLEWMTKAIVRTIELSSNVKFTLTSKGMPILSEASYYPNFWQAMFNRFKSSNDLPTIITFNYDLVLERSLFHLLFSEAYSNPSKLCPFDGLTLNYHYALLDEYSYQVKYGIWQRKNLSGITEYSGTSLSTTTKANLNKPANIEILKLHGSVSFPKTKMENEKYPVNPVEDAYILPPLLNKWTGSNDNKIWSVALERLRNAKNIIIVGYSLPQTDIYMQYFLKTGLGPNIDLNRIYIFNPTLFQNNTARTEMENRYANCFSPQMIKRIEFRPAANKDQLRSEQAIDSYLGRFQHFVDTIDNLSYNIFF